MPAQPLELLSEPLPDRIELELASDVGSVEVVETLVESLALRAGFDHDTAGDLALVSREATVNAVLHARCTEPDTTVEVTIEITREALSIRIADHGTGFDPATIPDPLASENLLRTSGRGVLLMRAIMDEVEFRQLTPGTELTLKKHRSTGEKLNP